MQWANSLLDTDTVRDAIAADVLHPGKHTEKVAKALTEPDLIADFSASVAVGRYLALDLDSPVRRVSAFLNPSGSDLVLLAEDQDRTVRLDSLEMQYYREVFRNPELQDHLRSAKSRLRYAQSCRDLSSTIPEDSVALHAAIGSRAVRHAVSENSATIRIWKADQALAVRRIEIAPAAVRKIQIGEWVLQTDETLISTIMSARKARLPVETGGVLLGSFDLERRIVYVIDAIPSPPDSIERPMAYIRGCQGLLHAVQNAEAVTGGMLQYIGEWHSHPDGFTVDPSSDDRAEFAWLGEHMKTDGLIPLMLIAGDSSLAWLLDKPELITLSAIAQHLA
jgi:integrative and conjugative element protein (TIGR02256 family)